MVAAPLIGAQGNRTSARSCTIAAAPGPTSSTVYGFPGAFTKENVAAKRESQKDRKVGKGDTRRISEGHGHFAQKCRELQGFVRPLNLLLNGLRSGKYRKGLTSFQESVAMDRIQRILGVLQNPHLGERYMRILLQVATMLMSWCPSVAPVVSPDKDSMSEVTRCKQLKRVLAYGSLPASKKRIPQNGGNIYTLCKPKAEH